MLALGLMVSVMAGAARAQEVRLLAFGDSLTAGYGLAQDEGFVPQLEAWLRAHGAQVRVINAGLSGDTTAGGRARLAWSLDGEVDAVLLALGGNDLLRGVAPEETRANLAAMIDEITARGLPVLLVGQRATGNFGADYKARFDAIYPELAQEKGMALYPWFLAALAKEGGWQQALRKYMQPDGLHPNARGVRLIVEDMGPWVLALLEQAQAGR